jgi:hypothetical protein
MTRYPLFVGRRTIEAAPVARRSPSLENTSKAKDWSGVTGSVPALRRGKIYSEPASTRWRWWEWRNALLDGLRNHEIDATALAVGVVLSVFADNLTGASRPSIAAIANRIGGKVDKNNDCRTVRRGLAALERAGLLKITRRGHMKPNLYLPICKLSEAHDRTPGSNHETESKRPPASSMPGHRCPANYSAELSDSTSPSNAVARLGDQPSVLPKHSKKASGKFQELLRSYPFDSTMNVHGAFYALDLNFADPNGPGHPI